MLDDSDVLEREMERMRPRTIGLDDLVRRRERKNLNQRLVAAVVAIAIFVAPIAWIAVTAERSGRTRTPAGPLPTVAPSHDERGLMGLAPMGAAPSTPKRGELVLSFTFGHSSGDDGRFHVYVYEDGRLIWRRLGGGTDRYATADGTGVVEQHLTPEGVRLVLDEVLSTGLFVRDLRLDSGQGLFFGQIDVRDGDRLVRLIWGECCVSGSQNPAMEMPTPEQASALKRLDSRLADPASWLPAGAWQDQEIRAYVPFAYWVCYEGEQGVGLPGVLASLPPPAEELLRAQDIRRDGYTNLLGSHVTWCSDLPTGTAHALARMLDDAGLQSREDSFGLHFWVGQGDPGVAQVSLSIGSLLPHET